MEITHDDLLPFFEWLEDRLDWDTILFLLEEARKEERAPKIVRAFENWINFYYDSYQ